MTFSESAGICGICGRLGWEVPEMVLIIDNFDSFVFNLAQAFGQLGQEVRVVRNDAITVEQALDLRPDRIVLSPGPGRPEESAICPALARAALGSIPILGVCLGHQCLGIVTGGTVVVSDRPMHGKVSKIHHDGRGLFRGLPSPFEAGRYHSLLVEEESLPPEVEVSAHTDTGEVMGLRVKGKRADGVQFHPESILTPLGAKILKNFLA